MPTPGAADAEAIARDIRERCAQVCDDCARANQRLVDEAHRQGIPLPRDAAAVVALGHAAMIIRALPLSTDGERNASV